VVVWGRVGEFDRRRVDRPERTRGSVDSVGEAARTRCELRSGVEVKRGRVSRPRFMHLLVRSSAVTSPSSRCTE
jgi:hypothetical protein